MKFAFLSILTAAVLVTGCGKEKELGGLPRPVAEDTGNQMLDLVNKARRSGYDCDTEGKFGPAPDLVWNDLLQKSAKAHAKDMNDNDYFDHTGLDGSSVSDRVDRTGYKWATVGENIARGQQSVEEVVQGWLDSDGHCKNIMEPAFSELGADRDGLVWVQNFGAPR